VRTLGLLGCAFMLFAAGCAAPAAPSSKSMFHSGGLVRWSRFLDSNQSAGYPSGMFEAGVRFGASFGENKTDLISLQVDADLAGGFASGKPIMTAGAGEQTGKLTVFRGGVMPRINFAVFEYLRVSLGSGLSVNHLIENGTFRSGAITTYLDASSTGVGFCNYLGLQLDRWDMLMDLGVRLDSLGIDDVKGSGMWIYGLYAGVDARF
jgi:hypothetical protein